MTHWIDGAARPPANGAWLDVAAPAHGAVYAQVAAGDAPDVDAAVAAASAALATG